MDKRGLCDTTYISRHQDQIICPPLPLELLEYLAVSFPQVLMAVQLVPTPRTRSIKEQTRRSSDVLSNSCFGPHVALNQMDTETTRLIIRMMIPEYLLHLRFLVTSGTLY